MVYCRLHQRQVQGRRSLGSCRGCIQGNRSSGRSLVYWYSHDHKRLGFLHIRQHLKIVKVKVITTTIFILISPLPPISNCELEIMFVKPYACPYIAHTTPIIQKIQRAITPQWEIPHSHTHGRAKSNMPPTPTPPQTFFKVVGIKIDTKNDISNIQMENWPILFSKDKRVIYYRALGNLLRQFLYIEVRL